MKLSTAFGQAPKIHVNFPDVNKTYSPEDFFDSEYGKTAFGKVFKELLLDRGWSRDFYVIDTYWKPGEEFLDIWHLDFGDKPTTHNTITVFANEVTCLDDIKKKIEEVVGIWIKDHNQKAARLQTLVNEQQALLTKMYHDERLAVIYKAIGHSEIKLEPVASLVGEYTTDFKRDTGWDVYCHTSDERDDVLVYYVHLKTGEVRCILLRNKNEFVAAFQEMETASNLEAFNAFIAEACPI